MAHRLLIVEDDIGISLALEDRFRADGYEVEIAANGRTGFERASTGDFDLIILDLILPEWDGLDVCRDLRRRGIDTPILMLTARAQLEDKLDGFSTGADDYLAKPFDIPELLARARVLIHRSARWNGPNPAQVYEFGDLRLGTKEATLWRAGEPIALSQKEYLLLHYFVTHPGQTLSRDELLKEVWRYDEGARSRTVDLHVGWLRKKIESDLRRPRWIRSVYGKGYQFLPEERGSDPS